MTNNFTVQFAGRMLAVALAAGLAACGGGGGGSSTATTSSSGVASASQATATALSASTIAPAAADTSLLAGANTAYDMTAAMGDSWRLVLNTNSHQFAIRVLTTAYGLSNTIPGTLTTTTNGNFITYSGSTSNGDSFKITVDTRTSTLSGSVTLAGMTAASAVVGSGVATTALTGLAGDYVFMNAAHNTDGSSANSTMGTLHVETNGLVELCPTGVVNAGHTGCSNVSSSLPAEAMVYGQLSVDAPSGHLVFGADSTHPSSTFNMNGRTDLVQVQAGDLGPVLVIDQDWVNSSSVRRAGVFLAARTFDTALVPANQAGSYFCVGPTISQPGVSVAVTSSGGSNGGYSVNNGNSGVGNMYFNQVSDGTINGSAPTLFPFNGGMVLYETDISNAPPRVGFALSSSVFVFQNSAGSLNYCVRSN